MGYISQENLVQNMTPDQRIMIAGIYSIYDIGSGIANKKIINVEPLFYTGLSLGSEFAIYSAQKLYIFLTLNMSSAAALTAIGNNPVLYNELNLQYYSYYNANIGYDSVAIIFRAINNNINDINGYFFRIAPNGYTYLKFIGYRVTLI